GNAKRLVERHGADMHYCHPWKVWLTWDGRRWAEDDTGEAVRRVKDTQAAFHAEVKAEIAALDGVVNHAERKAALSRLLDMVKHALRWEDAKRIFACLDLARSEPSIPVTPGQLDADPWLFNCLNGTLDLRTGELRPHRRADLLTKMAPVEYDPSARCPLWLKF